LVTDVEEGYFILLPQEEQVLAESPNLEDLVLKFLIVAAFVSLVHIEALEVVLLGNCERLRKVSNC
jgi:hypothetical protein